ncbi:MAG TPA: insulinase family protein, partial [Acidobacteriota bacterium]|nr:insulinase family protein [Acidobacteriota bacterium]
MRKITPILFLMLLMASFGYTQSLADFEKKVTQFKLDNGLTFIVVERHEVPVVSFFTYANVGSVD